MRSVTGRAVLTVMVVLVSLARPILQAQQSGKQPAAAPTAIKPLVWRPLGEPGSGGWMTGFAFSPFDSRRRLVAGDMLGIGLSEDGGKTWQATFGLKSYECGDFTWHPTDPKVVWAGTMSGPYVSRDGGRNWQERRAGLPEYGGYFYSAPIEKVLFDPADSAHLLAFGGSSRRWQSQGKPAWGVVWESRDGGDHWSRLADLGKNIVGAAWGSGAQGALYAALDGGGIWRSDDRGRTWRKASAGLPHDNVERIIVDAHNPEIAWTALDNAKPAQGDCLPGGIYKTTDGGANWRSISNGLSQKRASDPNFTARYKAFAVCAAHPEVMYTADGAWDTGVIYGTRDGGKTWQAQATRQNIGNDNGDPNRRKIGQVATAYFAGIGGTVMAVDPNRPELAYCVGSEHLIATTDGGNLWFDAGNDPGPDNRWRGRGYSGLCATNIRFNPGRAGDVVLLGMDAGKLWRSTDDMQTWTYHGQEPWPWGGGTDATYAGSRIYATAGQFGQFMGILRSIDEGKTFHPLGGVEHGLPALQSGNAQPTAIYARPDAPNRVWAIIGSKLYRTEDGGEKWRVVQDNLSLNWLAADPTAPNRLALSGERGVYLTTDGGATVTPIGGPKPSTRITMDAQGRLYAASWRGPRGGVWRWNGSVWTRLWDNVFVHEIAIDPADPNRIAVATHDHPYHDVTGATGVWLSADAGKTWRQANDGLAMLRSETIAFDPHHAGRLVFGTHGRGFFVTVWPRATLPANPPQTYAANDEDVRHAVAEPLPAPKPKPVIALRNGDMEIGNEIPIGWDGKWVGKGKLVVVRDTTVHHGGRASLRIASEGGEAQGQASQMVDGYPGAKFMLSGALKTAGNVKAHVAIQSFTDGFQPISFQSVQFAQNDTDWLTFTREVTLPDNTAHFGITLFLEGDGKAWLDDIKITGPGVRN